MYGLYQSGTARPYKMEGRLDWLSLVRAVPRWYGKAVPESQKTPFLRVFCSNPAENKQTLSSTKF